MTCPTLLTAVVEALRSAGAAEEIIAAAVKAGGAFCDSPPRQRGRRRLYADRALRDRAYRERKKARDEIAGRSLFRLVPIGHLRGRLLDVAQGHFDLSADLAPIRALLDQGCDLEADVVPIVARELPELPRPLKNWGAPWLVRDILAARDQRLAGPTS
jgi:hypothetical protein